VLRIALSALAGSLLAVDLDVGPAQAQVASRVFVAAQGLDANPCTFAQPCRTFQQAHNAVAAGGEIDVLDPAGYGALTISKSISIQGHGFAGIAVPGGGTAITINAGTSAAIGLFGLLIEGGGVGQTGIDFQSGRSLVIANTVVRHLTSSGIVIEPGGSSQIAVSNTLVTDNGGHGIYVEPGLFGCVVPKKASAIFRKVGVHRNALRGIGISGAFVNCNVVSAIAVDCVASNNQTGFYALGNGVIDSTLFNVFRSAAFQNQGILAEGGATIYVSQSDIDIDGWSANTGAAVKSYGDNNSLFAPAPSGTVGRN